MVFAFIDAILFSVPIAGELLGIVAELADIASIISIIGAVDDAAFDVSNTVDDPKNHALAIFSLIVKPLALMDIVKVARAAAIRRKMSGAGIAKLGGRVADRPSAIRKVS